MMCHSPRRKWARPVCCIAQAKASLSFGILGNEECQYVFVGDDQYRVSLFTLLWKGLGLVIGIGPIRTGKSFTKNTLACHFMKYGGMLQGIDVDIGMQPVAQLFGEDGAVFSMDG
ncbi:MAG: hypothetical protein R3B95_07820 [Nitrospirales bacterium]|nr:hypothetical protein [Nitrospirales bacterium]